MHVPSESVIAALTFRHEYTVFRLGPIERRVRRCGPHLWQIYDVHHEIRKASHIGYELDSHTTAKRAEHEQSAFMLGRFQIVNGPRSHGYQSHENRKIEKRIFWNHAKKYRRAQLVALEGAVKG